MRCRGPLAGWWVGVALVVAMVCPLWGSTPVTQVPTAELGEVRRQVRELEEVLRSLEQRQLSLTAERERLTAQHQLAFLRLREQEQVVLEVRRAEREAAAAAVAAQQVLERSVERLRLQLSTAAVLGRMGLMPLLLEALAAPEDLQRRVTLVALLVRDQERQRQVVAEQSRERMETLGALSRRRAEAAEAMLELEQRRLELERTRAAVAAELRRLEGERRDGAVALVEAREAEERLHRLLGRVAAGDDPVAGDVRLTRGGLPWPVSSARVVHRFGRQRDPRYGTVTVSQGVVLGVDIATPVQAIAPGRVVYAQFFRGYGNLVIVHHGQQIYSLYSRLGTMLVGAGARVATGEVVGLAGLHLEDGGNVYLEIREGEQPRDPLLWLNPAGK